MSHRTSRWRSAALQESHDENPAITPFIELLPSIIYKGNEVRIGQFNFGALFPPPGLLFLYFYICYIAA